jgi:membrane protease YdiL (CAAX protease family)
LAPLVEELFFRGFLYPALARRLGVAAGVALTALPFALIHASQLARAWAPLLLLFIVGLVLTAVRARTRSVGASFLVHVGYNATLFALLYAGTDGFTNFEKLA